MVLAHSLVMSGRVVTRVLIEQAGVYGISWKKVIGCKILAQFTQRWTGVYGVTRANAKSRVFCFQTMAFVHLNLLRLNNKIAVFSYLTSHVVDVTCKVKVRYLKLLAYELTNPIRFQWRSISMLVLLRTH